MSELPPKPDPNNMFQWANALYEFLLSQTEIGNRVEPKPLLMPHKVNGVMVRAVTPGIMLYDPVNETPIVSDGTEFFPIREMVQVLLAYETAFNVDGVAVSTGGFKVPLNTENYNYSTWLTFNSGTTDFTLTEGQYYFQGDVAVCSIASGNHTAFVYVAESTDLTTPVGTVISNTAHLASGQSDLTVPVPYAGELTVPQGGGTYSLVVRASSTNLRLGKAHGISGFDNYFARCAIAKIGVEQ